MSIPLASLSWRLTGGVLLFASTGAGFIQASDTAAAWKNLGAAASWAGGLIAFALACLGLLLLLHGPRFRRRWQAACDGAAQARVAHPADRTAGKIGRQELDPLIFLDPGVGGGRMAMTTYLILRAQQQNAAPSRTRSRCLGERAEHPKALHKVSM